MTRKKKVILAIAAVIVLGFATLPFLDLPEPMPLAISDASFNLAQIEDGTYPGSCDNGLVKVRAEVIVKNQAIAEVRLLQHDNGLGGAAEVITDTIVQRQSVEVDAISGATISSKNYIKSG